MVLYHALEKELVEVGAACGVELLELLVREHAGHEHFMLHPVIVIFIGTGFASGTGWPRSRNQVCMMLISSFCALMMRSQSVWTEDSRRATAPTRP